tara:strand:- start:448 stop:1131 length:684 start_codon:yes stop_codon:yes gene_type:complete
MKESKYKKAFQGSDFEKAYSIDEALESILSQPKRKFIENMDISVVLGIDPKKADQNLRGSLTLPHSLGKKVAVVAFVDGEKAEDAKKAGADFVGVDDLVDKYKEGDIDFDVAVTTPAHMKTVSKLAKILGPRGLMPNPKTGTVTENIGKVVTDIKHGQVRFKTEKEGLIQGTIANVSMSKEQLKDNLDSFLNEMKRIKPASAKGIYFKSVFLSTTMGPGYKIDVSQI